MRSIVVTALIAALPVALPASALADRSYNAEKTVTHDCSKEPAVSVNVAGGTYTFTGPCTRVSINGSDNKIKLDSVEKLAVNGSKNTVDVDAVDKLAVTGSDNTVSYKRGVSGKPKATSLGANNKLNQVK